MKCRFADSRESQEVSALGASVVSPTCPKVPLNPRPLKCRASYRGAIRELLGGAASFRYGSRLGADSRGCLELIPSLVSIWSLGGGGFALALWASVVAGLEPGRMEVI